MQEPKLQHLAGTYRYSWNESHNVNITLERVHEVRDYLTAEILVENTDEEPHGHIYQGRINLLASRSRIDVAKACSKRWDSVDWEDLIDYVCVKTLRLQRIGEPILSVGDKATDKPLEYLINPLIIKNQANLLYGPGGTGKSNLSVFLSLLYQSGVTSPVPQLKAGDSGKVLILDYETSAEEFNHRVVCLREGMNIPSNVKINYRFCHQSLIDDAETLQTVVLQNNIDLVIIDSYGMACGGDAWSQQVARDYFMALRALKCTTLTIDHVAKDNPKGPYGSVYKQNEARNIWQIAASQELGEDRLRLALYHRKANLSKLQQPIGLEFAFFDDGVVVSPSDVASDLELSQGLPLQDRIAATLEHGGRKAKDIAEDLDCPEGSVRKILNRYKGKRFAALLDGQWGNLAKTTD